ncbi:hypothetical protein [Sphingomonas gilva]|uniref:hypothetical protein n=1 Tax=Sphingomonas gilva TaxID=2305907 RepID=UPI0011C386C6|nr:hypothetical protein [Sphingomonas gilva]
MTIGFLALALWVGSAQGVALDIQQSATALANATKFNLSFEGRRVNGCTVTATSGNPQVDHYVCEAARSCGDRYSSEDRRADCISRKREELADLIVKSSNQTK